MNDYQNNIDIIFNGYEGLYGEIFVSLPRNIVPKEVSDELYEIRYMYDIAEISYSNLSEDKKKRLI